MTNRANGSNKTKTLTILSALLPALAGGDAKAQDQAFSIAGVAQDEDGLGGGDDGLDTGISNDLGANDGGAPAPNNTFGSGNNAGGNPLANGAGGNVPANAGSGNPVNTSAFGNTTTNAAAAPGAPANTAPANAPPVNGAPANAAAQPVADAGAQTGEPPVADGADLSGKEQQGNDSADAPTPSAGGRPMKLDFRGAPLTEVIRALSEESGVNFVFPPEIGAKPIYISFNNVPFNDALRALLEANALGMVEAGPNIVRIDTLDKLASDKEAIERRRKAELKLRPTKVLVQRLSYAKVEDAAKMLTDMLGAAAKEDNRVAIQIDARTNSVIVNAPPNDLSLVKALLERIDLETPQVKIAARIVEVIKTLSDSIGISWGQQLNYDQGRGLGFGSLPFPNNFFSKYAVDTGGPQSPTLDTSFTFGGISKGINLDLALKLEQARGTTEILQAPYAIVEDRQTATLNVGQEDNIPGNSSTNAAGQTTQAPPTSFKYELGITVKPQITADGAVQMHLKINNDSPAEPKAPGANASRSTQQIDTYLIRKSGETAVIGGIFAQTKGRVERGVPFFSSIPIIGALFRSASDTDNKRELMVMVTPTILNANAGKSGAGGADEASSDGNVALNDAGNGGNNNSGNNSGNGNANNVNFGNNASGNEDTGDDGGDGEDEAAAGNDNAGGGNQNAGGDNQGAGEE